MFNNDVDAELALEIIQKNLPDNCKTLISLIGHDVNRIEEDLRKLMPQIKLAEKIGQVNHIKSDLLTLLGQQSTMNMIGQIHLHMRPSNGAYHLNVFRA